MKVLRLPLVALSLLCIVYLSKAMAQDDDDPLPARLTPVTSEIETFALNAMSNCPPAPNNSRINAGINRNGVYTLVGDIFHNGGTNALINCHIHHGTDDYGNEVSVDNVILSKWAGRKWNSIGFIDFEPNWINQWSGRCADNKKPFWMIYLNEHPIIVVAGGVAKEGQNFACFLIDPFGKDIMDATNSFGIEPIVKKEYLLTGDSSRVKSTTEVTYYSKIRNGRFHLERAWGSYWPLNEYTVTETNGNVDYYCATSNNVSYTIIQDYSAQKNAANYVVFRTSQKTMNTEQDIVNLKTSNNPYAKIYLLKDDNGDSNDDLFAYLFVKLTGLPIALYLDHNGAGFAGRLESSSTIKVTGSPDAVKLLSP